MRTFFHIENVKTGPEQFFRKWNENKSHIFFAKMISWLCNGHFLHKKSQIRSCIIKSLLDLLQIDGHKSQKRVFVHSLNFSFFHRLLQRKELNIDSLHDMAMVTFMFQIINCLCICYLSLGQKGHDDKNTMMKTSVLWYRTLERLRNRDGNAFYLRIKGNTQNFI